MMLPVWITLIGEGFLVKSIASFDDTLTRIPVISHLTNTHRGRVAFSLGTFLALTFILIISIFFSTLLVQIPHVRVIVSGLIFLLAVSVYFDLFSPSRSSQIKSQIKNIIAPKRRGLKLVGSGFVISLATLIDDAIILVPLFLGDWTSKLLAVAGVYLAATLQILAVIYFGKRMEKIPLKKEIAAAALLTLSILVFIGLV